MQSQLLALLMLWLPLRWESAGYKLKPSLSRQTLCADTHWDNLCWPRQFGQQRVLPCLDSLRSIIWQNGFATSLSGNKMIIQIFRKCCSPIANVTSGVIITFCVSEAQLQQSAYITLFSLSQVSEEFLIMRKALLSPGVLPVVCSEECSSPQFRLTTMQIINHRFYYFRG